VTSAATTLGRSVDTVLELMACPICRADLVAADGAEVRCAQGHSYPVLGGVPRLLASNEGQVISDSFSHQWSQFDYDEDRTWGKTVEERVGDFLRHTTLDAADLEGKLVLDAGCGNAALSRAITDLGATVIATDISDSVFAAARRFSNNGSLHFVQSDLGRSVFKPGSFDVIYSGGVLHHTPDTRASLNAVATALRPGGTIFIWLYWRVPGRLYDGRRALRKGMAPLPVKVKHVLVAPLAFQNWVRHRSDHTWRETLVVQLDYYTPRYRWEHTPDEVFAWYRELGLTDVRVTEKEREGFGVVGRLPAN
jgi:SAM-dependent methyltransferase